MSVSGVIENIVGEWGIGRKRGHGEEGERDEGREKRREERLGTPSPYSIDHYMPDILSRHLTSDLDLNI